jgi:hypothetical protein
MRQMMRWDKIAKVSHVENDCRAIPVFITANNRTLLMLLVGLGFGWVMSRVCRGVLGRKVIWHRNSIPQPCC